MTWQIFDLPVAENKDEQETMMMARACVRLRTLPVVLALVVGVVTLGGRESDGAVMVEDDKGNFHFNTTEPGSRVLFNGHVLDALEERLQSLEAAVGVGRDKNASVSSLSLDTIAQLGTGGNDRALGVVVGRDGVVFTTGFVQGAYAGNGSHRGGSDIFVAAINMSSHEVLWRAQLGSLNEDTGADVAIDASHTRLYVVGAVEGVVLNQDGNRVSTPPPASNGSSSNSFVACLNSSTGHVLWAQSYGGGDFDQAKAIAVVGDASVGVPTLYVSGVTGIDDSKRGYVKALAGDRGVTLWFTSLQEDVDQDGESNGSNEGAATTADALVADAATGFLYVGGTTSGAFPYFIHQGNNDVFVAAMNTSTGSVTWVRQFGTSQIDDVGGIALDPAAGRIFVTGRTEGSMLGSRHFGNRDIFVAALSTTNEGALLWSRQFGQRASEFGRGIAVLGDGRTVLVSGFTFNALFGPRNAKYDAFVAAVDANNGTVLAAMQFGSPAWDLVQTLALDPSGNRAVVCGHTKGELSPTPNAGGKLDAFVARIHWSSS